VTTSTGSVASTQQFTVGVPASPPTVQSISPPLGPVGQWVCVSGSNFVFGQTTIEVGGVSGIPTSVDGPSSLGFRIPAGAAGSTSVMVTTPNGSATSAQTFGVGVPSAPPSVSNIFPTSSPVGSGVTVTGNNFVSGQSSISVGGVSGIKATVNGPNSLQFVVPAAASGSSTVTVTTLNGSAASSQYFVVSFTIGAPTLTSLSPQLGPPGQWVYVHGTNFVSGQTTIAMGGITGIKAGAVYNPTQLAFTVPAGATGTTPVTVTTPYGSATSSQLYTVGTPTAPPTATTVSPQLGPVGQWVYVNGTNFVTGQTTIAMGGISGITAGVYGPTSLGFTVPAGATGATPITVTTPYGSATTTQSYTVGVPTGPPTISLIKKYSGHNWVYVSGTEFVSGQTTVQIDGTYSSAAVVYGPTTLGFTPNSNWAAASEIRITTPNGTVNRSLGQYFPLSFDIKGGYTYQVQQSTDLKSWADVGEPIAAQDQAYRFMSDMGGKTAEYFRVVRTPP
jgi:hypothetical protein